VIQTAENDVLVLCSTAEERARQALEAKGIRVQQISATADGRPDFAAIVKSLGELEITSLLIEGGALVNGAALASGEVDKVFLYYAPKIFGEGAVPFIAGEGLRGKSAVRAALRVASLRRRLCAGRLSARSVLGMSLSFLLELNYCLA
jgi:diaminohydroxyphosphoribosylaminopyrimidine deaminase / 5-amino-6-(5-phosphoribosylamino)uracil reductase